MPDFSEEDIRRIAREEFQQLAGLRDEQIEVGPQTQRPDSLVWQCVGTVKDFAVWVAQSRAGKIVKACLVAFGLYGPIQFGAEIVAPGTLPDTKQVANDISAFFDQDSPSPSEGHRPSPERYMVFKDSWQGISSDDQLTAETQINWGDEQQLQDLYFIPASSGVVEQEIFQSGRVIHRSSGNTLGLSDSVQVELG